MRRFGVGLNRILGFVKSSMLLLVTLTLISSCSENKAPENKTQVNVAQESKTQDSSEMDEFVSSLMSKMTIEEKIGQLNLVTPGGGILTGSVVSENVENSIKEGNVGGIFGVSNPDKIKRVMDYAVKESKHGIPLLVGADVIHGYKTTFPLPLAMSCSWDMNMVEESAQIAAKEATADGIFWNFSPMVDVSRDPRWGRVAEGAGEDPYLGARIAEAMIKGYQQDDMTKANTMMATVKHMALYGAPEAGRDYNTVDMSRQRMYNDYFPPYKAAIEAGVGCVMSSFNDVDGIPATGNKWLLTEVLRNQWGFDGFVVSDYTSVMEMSYHGLGDLQEVSALSLKAGLDMDMVSEGFLKTLKKSFDEGKVSEADIDLACRRILEAKYKLGLFEDPYRYIDVDRPAKDILTAENRAVARKAAARSLVLIKNENQVLPLDKKTKVALIGPMANDKTNMNGTWAPTGDWTQAVPIFDGFKNVMGSDANVKYAKGANIIDDPEYVRKINVFGERASIDPRGPEAMIKEAVSLAKKSDVVVAVIGEATEMSGESSSRTNLQLPESQKKLVAALKKTGKPLVIVMLSGRPLAMGEEIEAADALIQAWHLGTETGNGIADVIFGDYNPSGKLTMSFPRNVGQVPVYYSSKTTGRPQPTQAFEKFKSNYLDVPNSPLLPFGYGLSYTEFEYSDIKLNNTEINAGEALKVSVEVKNTGDYDGEEVVQLYVRDLVASVTRPVKELKGFEKIFLKKGESRVVEFELNSEDLSFYNFNLEFGSEAGDFEVQVGRSSEDVQKAVFTLK